jgi:hypothetical protein
VLQAAPLLSLVIQPSWRHNCENPDLLAANTHLGIYGRTQSLEELVVNQPSTAIVIPSQPARLQVGAREIPVPSQPVSHESRNRRQVELLTGDPDCFILEPLPGSAWMAWLVGLMLVGLVGFLWVLGSMALSGGGWWGLVFLLMSLPFLGIIVLMARSTLYGKGPQRFQFDRRRGELIIDRRHGLSKEYQTEAIQSLSDIVAIQLLCSGYHSFVHTSESGPVTNEQFYTYELNLVFGDAQQSRPHLCTHADWKWMRDTGQKLGEFLRVPVVDQLCQGA